MNRRNGFRLSGKLGRIVSPRLTAIAFALISLPIFHAIAQNPILSDDAERGIYENYITNDWKINSPGISISQAVVHSGLYSWQLTPGSSAYYPLTMKFSPIYVICYFYIPSTTAISSGGSSGALCGLLSTTSWLIAGVGVTNKSGLLLLTATGLPTGTHAVSTGAWHRIEYQYGPTATVWLDGVQDITGTIMTETKSDVLMGMLNASGTKGSIYIDDIRVSSTQSSNPTAGLTVRHAYPTNRSAIRVKNYIWGAASTDSLVVSIDDTAVSTIANPATYQEPVVPLTGLSAGNHTLVVALRNSSGTTRISASETITAHGGTPVVAIDENNNLVRAGHKVFPISGWWLEANALRWYQAGYTNAAGWTTGWSGTYDATTYQQYLENTLECLQSGITMMGPLNQRIQGTCPASDTACSTEAAGYSAYASALKNHQCVLAWTGFDEASVQGWSISRLQGALDAVHANDNNHPFIYDDATFPLLHLEWYYPTLVADIYSSDNYPLCYAESLHGQGKQLSDWVHDMDREALANYSLVPNIQVLELYKFVQGNYDCTSNNPVTATAVSATTIYNEAWMAVIHGRKGISWYDNGSLTSFYGPVCASDSAGNCFPANPENHIGKFTKDIATITPDVVLAAPTGSTVTSNMTTNCNPSGPVLGKRVDATVREDSNNVWVFAARLTDPICSPTENSASPLSTSFAISGLGDGTATVLNENRTVSVTGGILTDTFSPWAVHLYQIPKRPVPAPPVLNTPKVK